MFESSQNHPIPKPTTPLGPFVPFLLLLNPSLQPWKSYLPQTGPWCQKGGGLLP